MSAAAPGTHGMHTAVLGAEVLPLPQPWLAAQTLGGRGRYVAALALLVCFYYTIPVIKTPLGYTTYPTLDDLVSIPFVLLSLGALSGRVRLGESRVFRVLVVAAVLALPSVAIGYTVFPTDYALKYGLVLTVHYWKVFLVFACVAALTMTERRFRRLLTVVWLGSVFVGVYAVLQYLGIFTLEAWVEEFAESGPWGDVLEQAGTQALGPLSVNHAVIGNYMVVALMITFAIIRTSGPLMKLLGQLSVPFFVLVAILSGSRAGLAGIVVGLVVYLVLSKVRPTALIALICGAAVIYFVLRASPQLEERFVLSETGKSVEEFSAGRLEGWTEILAYVLRRPYVFVTGVGLGNFFALLLSGEVHLSYAHNNYLHWLVEGGVIGLVLPLLALARLLKLFRALRHGDRFHREIGIAFCALLGALLWVAITQENFVPSPTLGRLAAYIAFLFGAAVALYRTETLRGGRAQLPATRRSPGLEGGRG